MAFRKAKNILGLKSFAAHSSVGHLKYSWEEGPEREPSHQRIQFPRLSKSRSYGMRGRTERWCIWWSSGSSSSGNREATIQHGIKYFWNLPGILNFKVSWHNFLTQKMESSSLCLLLLQRRGQCIFAYLFSLLASSLVCGLKVDSLPILLAHTSTLDFRPKMSMSKGACPDLGCHFEPAKVASGGNFSFFILLRFSPS